MYVALFFPAFPAFLLLKISAKWKHILKYLLNPDKYMHGLTALRNQNSSELSVTLVLSSEKDHKDM